MSPIKVRVREIRLRMGWSQQELADRAGVSQASIANLESGNTRRVDFDMLDAIAEALGVQPGDLIVKD